MGRPVFSRFASLRTVAGPLALVSLLLLSPLARGEANLRSVPTDHYLIHTDLDDDLAQDLAKRMDAMYEEYSRRLADFKDEREIPRLQVYLFAKQDDYLRF